MTEMNEKYTLLDGPRNAHSSFLSLPIVKKVDQEKLLAIQCFIETTPSYMELSLSKVTVFPYMTQNGFNWVSMTMKSP